LQDLDDRTLWIRSRPAPGDPLADNLTVNEEAGLIAIEFATRRRMRVNGRAEVAADGAVYIHVRQVYSNCPKYIRPREVSKRPGRSGLAPRVVRRSSLTHEQRQWIREADTFFVASHHPAGGTDASHRGGRPGFVRVPDADRLIWPDYPGNTMFQTLGNIAARPQSGLLFIDFERDRTLQLTGRARIIWDEERAGDFDGAERLLEFGVAEAIEISESPKT
jgi:predicted pyridoxine 5'-phosphate oxidase superfamily flavin-nucleotide-binding protein